MTKKPYVHHQITLSSDELSLLIELLTDIQNRPTYHLGEGDERIDRVRSLRGRFQGFKEREV